MPRVPDVLLNLAFLPACRRIAKLRFEDIVVCHRKEAHIDLSLLSVTHAINWTAHVIVNSTSRDAAKDPEPVPMGIEQHLVRLQ